MINEDDKEVNMYIQNEQLLRSSLDYFNNAVSCALIAHDGDVSHKMEDNLIEINNKINELTALLMLASYGENDKLEVK